MFTKHGESGECTPCNSNSEFYDQTSTTYAENIGQIMCTPHKTGCDPGFGFAIGSSHADATCTECK